MTSTFIKDQISSLMQEESRFRKEALNLIASGLVLGEKLMGGLSHIKGLER